MQRYPLSSQHLQETLLAVIGLRQKGVCGLLQDLFLRQFCCLIREIQIMDYVICLLYTSDAADE